VTLGDVDQWVVTDAQIAATNDALREAGRDGFELFVLWTGVARGKRFDVGHVHVPRQTSFQEEEGLHVRVDGDELHKLNVWLFENGETLGVQVHTHPRKAYHSETDDTYPMVTSMGGLSIVVPNFGDRGVLGPGTAVYRLGESGWTRLPSPAADYLITRERSGTR
jgi:hypothetical protein